MQHQVEEEELYSAPPTATKTFGFGTPVNQSETTEITPRAHRRLIQKPELTTVYVIDTRRHGGSPVIFQQLFPLCSCTAADRTLQIMLTAATTVCISVREGESNGILCLTSH
ncbi:hypothetical protein CHARACLAT_031026 [Characodon lateralis]|uniref:Uncharacterized protein n=1 Tax=Characodon lateralis TaxID=208331 RepID=A0ABU7DWW1_9TELE|nr:hypothetical protein [Characodon lateralis]